MKDPSSDTIITPCPILDEGEGKFQFYDRTCTSGNSITLGTPSIVKNCTEPSADQYVSSRCEKGDGFVKAGSDTIITTCTIPVAPFVGQYVKPPCQSGDPYNPGSDTKVASCSEPSSTTYSSSVCVMGDYHTAGSDTNIKTCLNPPNGFYTTAPCERGSSSTVGHNTKLKVCSKVTNPDTQVIKTPCVGGSSSKLGSDAVIGSTCPIGSILDTADSKYPCILCGDNKSTRNVGSERCDVCKEGFYMKGGDDFECVKCGEGTKCTGLLEFPQSLSSYIATADIDVLVKCIPDESCNWAVMSDINHRPGNGSFNSEYCAPGYGGPYCNMCFSGNEGERYYRTNTLCMKCPTMSVFALVPIYLVVALMVLGVLAVIVKATRVPRKLVSMMVTYLQLVASVKSLGLKWSAASETVLQATTPLNFNLQSIAPECDMKVDYESRWLSGQLFPLIVVMMIGLVKVLSGVLSGVTEKAMSHTKWSVTREQVTMSMKGFISSSLKIVLLLYLSLVNSTLNVFDCVSRGDGKSVLVSEPSIMCEVSEDEVYGRLRALAIVFSILYVFGIPLLVLFLLLWSRSTGPETPVKLLVRDSVVFLLEPYKPDYYYWKLIEMVRKVSIVFLPRLISSEYPELQGTILILLFGTFILHKYFARPYAAGESGKAGESKDFYNAAEFVYYVCLILIIASGISLNTVIEKFQYLASIHNVESVGLVYTVLGLVSLFGGVAFLLALGYKNRGKATTVAVDDVLEKKVSDSNNGKGGKAPFVSPSSSVHVVPMESSSTVVSINPVSGDGKSSKGRVAKGVDSVSVDGANYSSKGESDEVNAAQFKKLQIQLQLMTEYTEKLECQLEREKEKFDLDNIHLKDQLLRVRGQCDNDKVELEQENRRLRNQLEDLK